MIVALSIVSFVALWLLLAGLAAVISRAVIRLEKDDGPWRRGL